MTVVLFWIALFLIAIVAFLITARVQAVKWLNGVSLLIPSFIIFFSSGVLLHYPLYVEAVFAKGNFNVEALLTSLDKGTQPFVVCDG